MYVCICVCQIDSDKENEGTSCIIQHNNYVLMDDGRVHYKSICNKINISTYYIW